MIMPSIFMLIVFYAECYKQYHNAECRYAECRYAESHYPECRYTECRGAKFSPNFGKNWKKFNLNRLLSVKKLVK
jgi:hypothetical protein